MAPQIKFKAMTEEHLPLWWRWVEQPHVKNTWFLDGYYPPKYIHKKIAGNGYVLNLKEFLHKKIPGRFVLICLSVKKITWIKVMAQKLLKHFRIIFLSTLKLRKYLLTLLNRINVQFIVMKKQDLSF